MGSGINVINGHPNVAVTMAFLLSMFAGACASAQSMNGSAVYGQPAWSGSSLTRLSNAKETDLFDLEVVPATFSELPAIGCPTVENPDSEQPVVEKPDNQTFTMDDVREEMKKHVWKKGDYTITPYGILWGSAIYASDRVIPGPFILYVASGTAEGEDDFVIDTRRSRVGMEIAGPPVPLFDNAQSGGRLEADFQAVLGSAEGLRVVAPENQTGIQIRHAYAEVKNEDFRLMAGQTWDLISPLNPGMLTYAVAWGGGNIGFRRMQVRYERYLHFADNSKLSLQGALAQDIALDFPTIAESVNWPVLQGRCGLEIDPFSSGQPMSFGLSSHLGQQGFDFPSSGALPAQDDARIKTWSLNADARWPITSRVGIQGEFFTGENLSTFLGGIIQGINPVTRQPIASTGGWLELWCDWTTRLRSHVGCGIDDPRDGDIANLGRTQNSVFFINSSFDVLPKMTLGLEFSYWDTNYRGLDSGEAAVLEFTGAYGF